MRELTDEQAIQLTQTAEQELKQILEEHGYTVEFHADKRTPGASRMHIVSPEGTGPLDLAEIAKFVQLVQTRVMADAHIEVVGPPRVLRMSPEALAMESRN